VSDFIAQTDVAYTYRPYKLVTSLIVVLLDNFFSKSENFTIRCHCFVESRFRVVAGFSGNCVERLVWYSGH